jgi:hypothetical protein
MPGGAGLPGSAAIGPPPGGAIPPAPERAVGKGEASEGAGPPPGLPTIPMAGSVSPLMVVEEAAPPDPEGARRRCAEEDGGAACRGGPSRPTPVDEPSALALAATALTLILLLHGAKGRLRPSPPAPRRPPE